METGREIVLIYPRCGKYDLFIRDMPLGLLYMARLLTLKGYRVHIFDQRVEEGLARLDALLARSPLWVGFSIMTGEPIRHALELARHARTKTNAPFVWGGIHPTILPEQTLENDYVDFVIRGKGELAAVEFSEFALGKRPPESVRGLTWRTKETVGANPEDDGCDWGALPMVDYTLIPVEKYGRVGFEKNIFSILTSRNCPYKCTFCYNSSLAKKNPWLPDELGYVKDHMRSIIEGYSPEYLSFIDDDFFVDMDRAKHILGYLLEIKPHKMKVGFRGMRVSDILRADEELLDLMERVGTVHINIGVESGSKKILKLLRKGSTPDMAVKANRKLASRPFIPLYNFFSGIPQETGEDIRSSTDLLLQLVRENPNCQISGYHQYTPYPGNELFKAATRAGFVAPSSLEEWGDARFEDNARNCPWIDKERRRVLEMIYSAVYFVDDKYETYIAKHNGFLKMMLPFVRLYTPMAKWRLRRNIAALPVEVKLQNFVYKWFGVK